MGRHSSDEQWPFYQSMVAWFLPWAVVGGILIFGAWIAVDALGQDELAGVAPSPSPSPSPTPRPARTRVASPTPTAAPGVTPSESPSTDGLITEGISVQVLNSTGDEAVVERVTAELSSLGYSIATVQEASRQYDETTVFWSSPDFEAAATALAEHFDWVAAPKPESLSAVVSIHVVVGVDEL